jgi:hypothetical protein
LAMGVGLVGWQSWPLMGWAWAVRWGRVDAVRDGPELVGGRVEGRS